MSDRRAAELCIVFWIFRQQNKSAQGQQHVGDLENRGCTECEHELIKMWNCWLLHSCINESRHMKLTATPPMAEQTHTTSHSLPSLLSIKDRSSSFKQTPWLDSLFLCLPLPYDLWRGETPIFFPSSSKCSTIVICFCHLPSLWNTHTRQWSIHSGPRERIFMCET